MTDNKKPREWIIHKYLTIYDRPSSPPGNQLMHSISGPDTSEPEHVIEYAAFIDLLAEAMKLRDILDLSRRNQYEASNVFDQWLRDRRIG